MSYSDLMSFKDIENGMLWRGSAIEMIEGFARLDELVGGGGTVVGSHRSKSIDLPKLGWSDGNVAVVVLDNFFEFNLHYSGPSRYDLTYEECGYHELSYEWYLKEIEGCEGYSWKGWSEEELNDPRITRVQVQHESGGTYWKEADIGKKERWLRRFENAEWYSRDWSAGQILGNVAEAREGKDKLYVVRYTYDAYTGHYWPGASKFSLVFKSGADTSCAPLIRKLLGRN
jgi:hypothetical protein